MAEEQGESLSIIGDDLFSIVATDAAHAQRIATKLRRTGRWLEVVPGMDTVAVRFDAAHSSHETARAALLLALAAPADKPAEAPDCIRIPVRYGGSAGPDFDDVCRQLQLTGQALIALHTSREFRVDMLGFTPGFAYIGGLDEAKSVARLATPREFVAAGSVGIAAGQTGIYALPGPGGWPVIGRTSLPMFDASWNPPFRLYAGARVRFVAAAGLSS
ncbi:MAG TPA: 5-oxoprolinase subunit PxpB [Woeseiaceae bacterium]|nr:5-oxoprolinase subunit PxpB [Woeseiaceae bacterium]